MSKSESLYVKDMNLSESDGDKSNQLEWDERRLSDAYDKAINVANVDVAKRLAMSTNSQQSATNSQQSATNSQQKQSPEKEASKKKKKSPRSGVNKSPWKIGMPCRTVYDEDGFEYEALIVRLINSHECVVQFLGYDNLEIVPLDSLRPSLGREARSLQIEVAINEQGGSITDTSIIDDLDSECDSTGSTDMSFQKKKKSSKKSSGPKVPGGPFEMPKFSRKNRGSLGMPLPPPMPPPTTGFDPEDQAVTSMLLSWYMSGYYTGLYQGLKRAKESRGDS